MAKAHARNNTFWNEERVKRGWSYDTLSSKLNIPKSTLARWFVGIGAPSDDDQIMALCNLFGVDFDTGYNHFYRSQRNWDAFNTGRFWDNLRHKNKLSLRDLSEITNIPVGSLSTYFTGRIIPNEAVLDTLCNLFGVNKEEGRAEFVSLHKQYVEKLSQETAIYESDMPTEETSKVDETPDYNFWPNLFETTKISYHDLGIYLGVPEERVMKYFSGEVTPNFNQIRKLCALYGGLDMQTGSKRFEDLHDHFITTTNSESAPSDNVVVSTPDKAEAVDVFELIYGKIPYRSFLKIYEMIANKDKDTLLMLYGKVDYETYAVLYNALKDWCN